MFTGDIALIGFHQPFARRQLFNRGDRSVAVNLGTTRTRTLGQRLR